MLTSTRSAHVARLRRLHERKGRQQSGTFLAEGPDCVAAALDAGWACEVVSVPGHRLADRAAASGVDVHEADERVIAAICDAKTPQGIVAECSIPDRSIHDVLSGTRSVSGPIVICDRIADPGNLGTILRTAEAVYARGVVITHGSVDPWNPKVVRASTGSIFRIPVVSVESAKSGADRIRSAGWKVVALTAHAPVSVFDVVEEERRSGGDPGHLAWLVGSEAHGVSVEGLEASDVQASIPMSPVVESLNAAISIAICLYLAVGVDLPGRRVGNGT